MEKIDAGYGTTLQWLQDGRIAVITPPSEATTEAIDAWAKLTREVVKGWSAAKPYLVLHNISALQSFSPSTLRYIVLQVEEVNRLYPRSMAGREAVIVGRTPIGHLIRLTAFAAAKALPPTIETRVFFDADIGITWLEEALA